MADAKEESDDECGREESTQPLGARLYQAVCSGSAAEVASLLEAKADPTRVKVPGQSLGFLAAARRHASLETCRLLVAYNVDLTSLDTQFRQTPLFYAVRAGEQAGGPECAEYLLRQRCDPNHVDANGQTPLFYAAQRTDPRCIEVLLAHGAHVNHLDGNGLSAMFHAAQTDGPADSLVTLLRARSDLGHTNNSGHTALFYAKGALAVQALLAAGASPAVVDACLRTPLFFAARCGASDVVRALLNARADASHKDRKGLTCGSYSTSEVIQRLLSEGPGSPDRMALEPPRRRQRCKTGMTGGRGAT